MYAAVFALRLSAGCCGETTEGPARQTITTERSVFRMIFLLGERSYSTRSEARRSNVGKQES
jgi:hypothetical protein